MQFTFRLALTSLARFALGLALCSAGIVRAQQTFELGPAGEQALLAGDWPAVLVQLERSSPPEGAPLPPVARILRGHALLATNRNDESLEAFLGARAPADAEAWSRWATGLAARHPDRPLALHLAGDACARSSRWPEALDWWGRALGLDPQHVPSLNARGVAYCRLGKLDAALVDLHRAAAIAPGLADAHANVAAMWIVRGDGARGGLAAARRALEKSPAFLLARYSEACLAMVVGEALPPDVKGSEALPLSRDWVGAAVLAAMARMGEILAHTSEGDSEENPSMELTRALERASNGRIGGPGGAVNDIAKIVDRNPALMDLARQGLARISANDPLRGGQIRDQLSTIQHYNTQGGASWLASLASSISAKFSNPKTGTSLGIDLRALGDRLGRQQQGMANIAGGLAQGLPPTRMPSGFAAGPRSAVEDLGAWKLEALFGLVYPAGCPDDLAVGGKR